MKTIENKTYPLDNQYIGCTEGIERKLENLLNIANVEKWKNLFKRESLWAMRLLEMHIESLTKRQRWDFAYINSTVLPTLSLEEVVDMDAYRYFFEMRKLYHDQYAPAPQQSYTYELSLGDLKEGEEGKWVVYRKEGTIKIACKSLSSQEDLQHRDIAGADFCSLDSILGGGYATVFPQKKEIWLYETSKEFGHPSTYLMEEILLFLEEEGRSITGKVGEPKPHLL